MSNPFEPNYLVCHRGCTELHRKLGPKEEWRGEVIAVHETVCWVQWYDSTGKRSGSKLHHFEELSLFPKEVDFVRALSEAQKIFEWLTVGGNGIHPGNVQAAAKQWLTCFEWLAKSKE